jgi:hypothetical protein
MTKKRYKVKYDEGIMITAKQITENVERGHSLDFSASFVIH